MSVPEPFQVTSLVNPPSFPNSIVWSEDNLIAVAAGDIVTILSPEHPQTPRGVITLAPGKPFPVGVIDRADLLSGCLLPTCLSRDRQPCVRSLSWSPVGFAPNNGCLLAVCSAEGRVKAYRQPYCEFQAEWIEILDISDMLHGYFAKINYGEPEVPSSAVMDDSASQIHVENYTAGYKTTSTSRKENKRKRINAVSAVAESVVFPSSTMQEGSSVEVFKMEDGQNVWLAGRLQCIDGSMALVHFHKADANGEPQWIEMDSVICMRKQFNHPDLPTANGNYSFPSIRPSMDVSQLPEQILMVEHNEVGEILKAGKVIEAWTRDRWIEGTFVGFCDGGLRVKFSEDEEAVELNPTDVRLAPQWIAEEKSWKVTVVQVHAQESPEAILNRSGNGEFNSSPEMVPAAKAKMNFSRRTPNTHSKHLLTACQYSSRCSMLASLVVAWSPVLQPYGTDPDKSCDCYCLLAVGTKSGNISIWRIQRPAYYVVEHRYDPMNMVLVGVLQAHNAWVTALSWGFLPSDSSQVLLASGCSDGSVKTWLASVCNLKRSTEANQTPFFLFNEVTTGDDALVSALSLYVPVQSPQKVLLAVGRGSGSFEVWTSNTKTKSLKKVGSHDAHIRAVTGLTWAFDGRCLYSCSQDNSLHGWIHHKGCLSEVSIPPNNLGIRNFSDLPSVSDSCYGMAISPGNLALAVARRFDVGQLDHMYQKRTQRAAVEFFWIGGQQVDISSTVNLELNIEACPGFSKRELGYWGSKLLWSLNLYECHSKHLVIWDIVAALLAFKQCAPEFVKHIVLRWLELLLKDYLDPSIKGILLDMPRYMSKITSRQLHLLNIFCRRIVFEVVKVCAKASNIAESRGEEEHQWMDILLNSEKELRQRLVGLSLSTVVGRISYPVPQPEFGSWNPVGIAQMMKWVMQNQDHVSRQLSLLASEVEEFGARLDSVCEYKAEEQCSFCSAAVPFESPEIAICQGVKCSNQEAAQQHKQARCAVSMQVCPVSPLWFCMCCQRRVSNLPPHQLFTMQDYPPDLLSFVKPVITNLSPNPLCPFCGISLQRLQPDFLLSISPV